MGNCERIFVIWDLYISFHLLVLLFTHHWQTGALPRLPPSGSLTERRAGGVCSASELASASSCGSGNCDHCPCDTGPSFSLGWPLLSHCSPHLFLPVLPPLLPVLRVLLCHLPQFPLQFLILSFVLACFVLLTAATPFLLYA